MSTSTSSKNNWFSICCGEGEEEAKYGALVDPEMAKELGWSDPPRSTTLEEESNDRKLSDHRGGNSSSGGSSHPNKSLSDSERIRLFEEQISHANMAKDKNLDSWSNSNSRRNDRGATIYGRTFDEYLVDEDSDKKLPYFAKTDEQKQFLQEAIRDHFIFMDLTKLEKQQFINAMQYEPNVPYGTKIIQQGDNNNGMMDGNNNNFYFYIVETGIVEFVDETTDSVVGTCHAGMSFGELSLLYDSPRAVSCVAADVVNLWKVDQITFKQILARYNHNEHEQTKDTLRNISLFKDLDPLWLCRFVKSLVSVRWKAGTRIVQKGEEGTVFYIIQSGQVKVHDIGLGDSQQEDLILSPGEWFGERALLLDEPRAANVTAISDEDVVTLAMDRHVFETSIMGESCSWQQIMDRKLRGQALKVMPLFSESSITNCEIEQLADLMEEVCYRKGEHLAEAGQPYPMNLWFIRHGRLLVYKYDDDNNNQQQHSSDGDGGRLYNLQSGDYFGDKSIKGDIDHISSHTATCEENLTTWVLTREQIESVIDDIDRLGNLKDFSKLSKVNQSIPLQELIRHRMLGKGAFGKVWLVSHRDSANNTGSDSKATSVYALKTISKLKIVEAKLQKAVLREKELLSLLNHPFILSLVASYQDEDNLYLLLPVIPGGELYSVWKKLRNENQEGLTNSVAAFYGATIIEALGHLHHRQIAYRDLKLENVLIDEDGYGILVDLGFAKVVTDKTFTMCGTPEYIAPEIIMSKGHDYAVDYWSYGVLIYELLVGQSPFYIRGSSQIDMFKRIVTMNYVLPSFLSAAATSLIEKLLVRKVSERLGNLATGYLDIKKHPWFQESGIAFKSILRKDTPAPWKPTVKDPLDATDYFDNIRDDLEFGRRLLLEEQEVFKGF